MSLRVFTVLGALVVARVAQAQAATPPPTAQQMFDAGEDAIAANHYGEAVTICTALEGRRAASGKPNSRSLAVARLRLGQSEYRLHAFDAAIGHLLPALDGLTAPTDATLRVEGLDTLGHAEEETFAPSAAAGHLRAALALVPPDQAAYRAALGLLIARDELFDDPARVAAELASAKPKMLRALAANKVALSEYWLIYGRALMMQRAMHPARAAFEKAIDLTGGLTTRISFYAQSARADAALAAELSNDTEGAARLTAYTGAGMMQKSSLNLPADSNPPPCGGIAELKLDDYAVVQFSIDDDGSVVGPQPVFASRPGPMAYVFARAVAGWSWTREQAAAIDPFFRSAARVEMRCTTRADRQTAIDLLKPDYAAWAAGATDEVQQADVPSAAAAANALRTLLVKLATNSGAASPKLVPVLVALARNPTLNTVEQSGYGRRAAEIAAQAGAPPAVRAWLGLAALTPERGDKHDRSGGRKQAAILALARSEPIASSPHARAGVELVAAEHAAEYRDLTQSREILERIVTLPSGALGAEDSVRRAAAIRLASLQAASGARETAAATFASSGIAANQCALLDQSPLVKFRNYSDNDYPDALLHLGAGFEGWAITEFDVTRDGRTENARVLIAYPPFLFGDAAAHISKRTVYRPSFRPDGALSCGGYHDHVNFRAANLAR